MAWFGWMLAATLAGSGHAGEPPRDDANQPASALGVRGLLYAQPFTLADSYRYEWSAEMPSIHMGTILVVAVDPSLARPRDARPPVLYAGDTPVEIVNTGYSSGNLVVVVPEGVDPATRPLYYGEPALPEQIDAEAGGEALAMAWMRGASPFLPGVWDAARAVGGEPVELADRAALYRLLADLVDRYAPDEHGLAESWRLPPAGG